MFRSVVLGVLIASFALGSLPAGVGAQQYSRLREKTMLAASGMALLQSDMNANIRQLNDGLASKVAVGDVDLALGSEPQGRPWNVAAGTGSVAADSSGAAPDTGSVAPDSSGAAVDAGDTAVHTDDMPAGESKNDAAIEDRVDADQGATAVEAAELPPDGNANLEGVSLAGDTVIAERAAAPNPPAAKTNLCGRDFIGQSTAVINGVTYILIGNEQQLRAIGSDKKVVSGQVWSIEQEKDGILGDWHDVAGVQPVLEYAGDADLAADSILRDGKIEDHVSTGLHTRLKYFTYNADGTRNDTVDALNSGLTYSIDANYLIFRDIDLRANAADPANAGWEPLMFSSIMLGAKSAEPDTAGSLWSCVTADGKGIADVTAVANPVISNVSVVQSGSLSVAKQQGVGFFGTITSNHHDDDVFADPVAAKVSNITLKNVTVDNGFTKMHVDQTLISALGSLLGGLVSGLLGLLLGQLLKLLGVPDLTTLVKNLLTIRAADPTSLATGAFAGRVIGDVEVSGCEVINASVSSINDYTGGFVGQVQGETLYTLLSKALDGLVKLLAGLLNVVPGVGLGDLITLLLGDGTNGILQASELMPRGYVNPLIADCSVDGFVTGETIGSASKDYAGGFAGLMVGSVARNCLVRSANAYTVTARLYAGGFAGLMRNDVMKGTLTEVGIELIRPEHAQSQAVARQCEVVAPELAITAESCAGGFAGAMANSHAIDVSVGAVLDVAASGHNKVLEGGDSSYEAYAGGFTGTATLGWVTDLGDASGNDKTDLISVANEVLVGALSGKNAGKKQLLLSLAGVKESQLLGVQVTGDISVSSASDYAGGIAGCGNGAIIAAADQAHLAGITLNEKASADCVASGRGCTVAGLRSVKAAESCAGGIAGMLGTADAGMLINKTVGLGNFLPFNVSSTTVTGVADGLIVTAGDSFAAAGIGKATGGKVGRADAAYGKAELAPATSTVAISNIKSVTAKNNVGGFAGAVGPGELAATGGLDLLGLGLLQANGLLGAGAGLEVKIDGVTVSGVSAGMQVIATGKNAAGEKRDYAAAGFIASANSAEVTDGHVKGLALVSADTPHGVAGGFVGVSRTGGLAEVSDANAIESIIRDDKGLVQVDNLINAVGYLVPNYTKVDVRFIDGGTVKADVAGGFAGDFQSGELANPIDSPWAVYNIAHVRGGCYAGGFGGRVTSGALAAADGGVSILGGLTSLEIGLTGLLGVLNAYVPTIERAGVRSDATTLEGSAAAAAPGEKDPGFTVAATRMDMLDSQSGAAGGFIGYGSGVQVSDCDVTQLRHTVVTEPRDLEGADGAAYFDAGKSSYAVKAPRYAGGFMGKMDVGSAASVGKGLNVLGKTVKLTDIASALSVVVSTVEHSDVNGGAGGFAVLATETNLPNGNLGTGAADPGSAKNPVGSAGGFAGEVRGGHIQDSNACNFSYIVGQVAAGGYAGTIAPGDVASVLASDNSILNGLVGTSGALASIVQDFVPTVRNSKTTCVPCGGAVRAQAASDEFVQRGMAGGYVGHNEGGHIWGNNNAPWMDENDASNHYTGTKSLAIAERIRSVYGAEFAGGYTGLLEPADTAKTGSLSLLFGLVKAQNLLGALEASYPTQENAEVTGPLRGMSLDGWNAWVKHVGSQGGYGEQFAGKTFATQEELDAFIASYVFGTNVVAGRTRASSKPNETRGGVAGGYVGLMHGGVITHGAATDTKLVSALRAAGGFAGSMETADTVSLGSFNLLELVDLNLGNLVSALDALVPVVKSSSVTGYRKGMTVRSTGTDTSLEQGYAGGYVGYASGAQIWGDATFTDANKDGDRWTAGATHAGARATGCNVQNLRKVSGANCIGGYAGVITAAGVADANTNSASDGLLQMLLDVVVNTPQSVASVLKATVSTVRGASVSGVDGAADPAVAAWGFTVEGSYGDAAKRSHARAAGGFVGLAKAVVLGTKDGGKSACDTVSVNGLRGVEGGQYAGGFVGQADVTGAASVGGATDGDQSTDLLLGLLKAGNIAAIEAFRPYFHHANVDGVADGFQVRAHDSSTQGILDAKRFTGAAGGFAGSVVNGSVKDCAVMDLMSVSGVNYTGGFVGHLGKAGTVDADNAGVNKLLGATAGVLDVWGAHVERSSVAGVAGGYTVSSTHHGADYGAATDGAAGREVAGGFVGYADLARVLGCKASGLKLVTSGEIAGGFAGEARRASLIGLQATSPLVDFVLKVVNLILRVLYTDGLQNLGVINLGSWFGIDKVFDIKLLAEGNTAYVNLFGLKIGVALSRASAENQQQSDVAIVTIGDSVVELPCTKAGGIDLAGDRSELTAQLIKANRARVQDCSVAGIAGGYDVFGGSASQEADGKAGLKTGYAGGFSGLNDEGVLYNNDMYYADVVRGTAKLVDPFANTVLKSVWSFNNMADIVGPDKARHYNVYRIYRPHVEGATNAVVKNGAGGSSTLASAKPDVGAGTFDTGLDRYDVNYFELVNCYDQDVASSGAAGDDDTKWVGVKGAVRLGAPGTDYREPLGVYESAAKAVLMLDEAQAGNDGVITPEPDEGQDPCASLVDITIQKVWNDRGDKEGKRPQSIEVILEGFYHDEYGVLQVPRELVHVSADGAEIRVANPQRVTLSVGDASGWTDTWRKVVAGLPVAFMDEGGRMRYYSYRVTEVSATFADGITKGLAEAGYTVTYGAQTVDRAITITNTNLPVLPETGGRGIWLVIAAGGMLLAWGVYERRRRSFACAGHGAGCVAGARIDRPYEPRHARNRVSSRRR